MGLRSQSRFLYQLHFSPVPHSDRLISPPSIRAPRARRTGRVERGALLESISRKDPCLLSRRRVRGGGGGRKRAFSLLFPQPPGVWI